MRESHQPWAATACVALVILSGCGSGNQSFASRACPARGIRITPVLRFVQSGTSVLAGYRFSSSAGDCTVAPNAAFRAYVTDQGKEVAARTVGPVPGAGFFHDALTADGTHDYAFVTSPASEWCGGRPGHALVLHADVAHGGRFVSPPLECP